MERFEYGGKEIILDDDGYLKSIDDWDEKTACGLAEHEGIEELTKEKLEIIKFMRDYYKRYNAFPILNAICKNVHQSKKCVNEGFVDPIKAWKIAGLPKPSEEVVVYLKR